MSGIKGLLVDLDGTLVDTNEANFAAYRAALAELGVDLSRDWWQSKGFGRSWRQFLPEILAGRNSVDPKSVANRKASIYPRFMNQTQLNTPLVQLIETLRPALRTALVTTASRTGTEAVLRHHQIGTLFETIVTGDDVKAHKPAPEAFAEAARRLEVEPRQCLVIEDSKHGLAAAQAFGAPCLMVGEIATAS